ncbi:MAG: dihydroneopterin aldolase [Candidatus Melainabacteria bacterium]|nr:dihydroneopterin aldolase [Candidatus Melainabacteria bacterium]
MRTVTADCLTIPTAGVTIAEVKNWVLPFQVGILPQEQGLTQPLRFHVRVAVSATTVQPLDDGVGWQQTLAGSFDYRIIIDTLQALAEAGHTNLLEDIATAVETACLGHPQVLGLWLKIEKLGLLPNAESIGIERTTWR